MARLLVVTHALVTGGLNLGNNLAQIDAKAKKLIPILDVLN